MTVIYPQYTVPVKLLLQIKFTILCKIEGDDVLINPPYQPLLKMTYVFTHEIPCLSYFGRS